ncbi:uncharacterized protein C8A04DRAFT_31652 [Dichotomopilus funicola]|uniref:Nephrocystin 3-like N-terminal domain-containing protein n=1 Tax=Dichotomopilus funicola TaxID=1934379 RepID=A0AAN6ZKK3_9PEZI|nr:hypothetical protein C8A04DRAFT_31652 [Dichotomopilus funicola]
MDPATSIGMVSGILSFVTFAWKLVKGGAEIYRQGTLAENATLEDVLHRAEAFHVRLQQIPSGQGASSSMDVLLYNLAKDCQTVSGDLIRLLGSMKHPDTQGLQAKWKLMVASWNNVIHAKERTELEEKLGRCETRLSAVLIYSSSVSISDLGHAAEKNSTILVQLLTNVDELKRELQTQNGDRSWMDGRDRKAIETLIGRQEEVIHKVAHSRILRALRYQNMRDRDDSLQEHLDNIQQQLRTVGGSYSWLCGPEIDSLPEDAEEAAMMKDARDKLRQWLSSDGGIFHIAGKFGSGKSTLMQLLRNHPEITNQLERWAGQRTLVKPAYFFSVMVGGPQQQLSGLFKTLLHDILKECPELAPEVLPEIWRTALDQPWQASGTHLTISPSLVEAALRKIICDERFSTQYCFCIFIDALDEYQDSGGRDQTDLVDLLHEWAPETSENVKLCVASREEPAFYNKFPVNATLRLHELTRFDMRRFVMQRLPKIPEDVRNSIVEEIPQKAEGIFLWATLVIQEIREDWESTGEVDIHVLDKFPAGFRPLVDRIYSFLEEYCRDPSFAHRMAIVNWEDFGLVETHQTEEHYYSDTEDCRIIESPAISPVINFAHRSILEYFRDPLIEERLMDAVGFSSLTEVADAICQTFLAELSFGSAFSHHHNKDFLEGIEELPFYKHGEVMEWTLREWIEWLDVPNKNTLLQLVNERLAANAIGAADPTGDAQLTGTLENGTSKLLGAPDTELDRSGKEPEVSAVDPPAAGDSVSQPGSGGENTPDGEVEEYGGEMEKSDEEGSQAETQEKGQGDSRETPHKEEVLGEEDQRASDAPTANTEQPGVEKLDHGLVETLRRVAVDRDMVGYLLTFVMGSIFAMLVSYVL